MFKLNTDIKPRVVSQLARLKCPPIYLVELFGEPGRGDGCNTSGEYTFTNDSGDFFIVHDFEATTIYWGQKWRVPTPEKFWHSKKPKVLYINGRVHGNPRPFIEWLLGKMKSTKKIKIDYLVD